MASPVLSPRSSFESLCSNSSSILSESSSTQSISSSINRDAASIHSDTSSIIDSPDKLAPPVVGPMVWQGDELNPKEYIVQLSNREIRDIRAAIIKFKLSGLELEQISRENFDLGNPRLVQKLSSLSTEIHSGRGVVVLRGLDSPRQGPRDRLSDLEAVIAFTGLCSYICPSRATDSYANQTLSHVRDASKQSVPADCKGIGLAGSKIPAAMEFHSDRFSGDVLALFVRDDGGQGAGGEQFLTSFSRVYNELLETEPEVLETMLEADWPFELKNKDNTTYLSPGPILFFSHGLPICQLVKAPLLGTPTLPRSPHLPSLTPRQQHALSTVETLCKRFSTQLDRRTGDLQFVHNLSVLHARSAYRSTSKTDGEASSRHLLRMFLRDPERAWKKPKGCYEQFEDPFEEGRVQLIPVVDTDPWRLISGRESHG